MKNCSLLKLDFDEKPIPFGEIVDRKSTTHKPLIPSIEVRSLCTRGGILF